MMKTRKYIAVIFAAMVMGISGCNDDLFLEEHPDTFYTAEDAFKTVDQVKACVTNMYAHARYWLQNDVFLKGAGTDMFDTPMWRSSGNGMSNFSSWSTDKNEVKNIYEAYYQLVSYANQTLEGAEVKTLNWDSENDRAQVRAQANFFRGFAYLTLGELFGGVPEVTKFYQEPRYDFTRMTREETYRFAIQDLKNAADNLAGIVQPTFYRVNEAAARILLSRVYLYMGEWQLAIDECDKVLALGCKLRDMNGLDEKWLNTVNSPEILFTQGSYAIGGLMNNNLSRYGITGGGRYRVSDELLALYKKYKNDGVVDLRESVFLEPSSSYCPGYFFIRKTPDYSNNRKGSVKVYDACLIRSAEVYLNKAEAQAMLDQPDAISTVKVLMEKRYKDGVLPAIDGLKGKGLVDFIREERRRELTCEGHRWFDLRRYAVSPKYPELKEITHGVYQSAMASLKPGVYDGSYTLKPYGQDNAWVLPIPDYEIIFDRGAMVDNDKREPREKNEN